MSDQAKPAPKQAPKLTPVRLVDEAYEAPADAGPIEKRMADIATAKREGRAKEKAIQIQERAKEAALHAGNIAGINQAHTEEIARLDERWSREEQKHGSGKFWSGVTVGGAIVGALVAVGTSIVINMTLIPTFEAAREARVQDDVVRATERYAAPITEP